MPHTCILAYDLGTTGNKASLFDETGALLASSFQAYATFFPQPGWAEQDPASWWDSVAATTRELLDRSGAKPANIAAIGLSGHMMGCLPVTADGQPLMNSIIHADCRSTRECAEIEASLGGETVYRMTGQRLDPHYPLSKIMWVKKHSPGLFRKAALFVQCKDFIVFRLTGRLGLTDFSDATLMSLYDIHAMKWSEEVMLAAGIDPRLLPSVVPSATVAGHVTPEAAACTGLAAGTPVIVGAGDGASATLGAGAVATGDTYNYVGGTSWIATLVERPPIDPLMRLFVLGSCEMGRCCAVGTIQCAGSALEWLADTLCQKEQEEARELGMNVFDEMDRLARQSPPGAHKLFFLPYLMGERAPIWDPDARGVLLGLTLAHNRADIIRAVLEGVSYALNSILSVMEELAIDVKDMRIIGGGAKSGLWLEIMASVYRRPLRVPTHVREATSLGAALAAGVGVGIFADYPQAAARVTVAREQDPNPDWTTRYVALHSYYESLYPALRDSFKRLAQLDVECSPFQGG